MIAVRRRLARNVALVATVVAISPMLAGCWQGFGASTTMQNSMNSGNGTQEIVGDRKSTRLNSSHIQKSRMPSSA